MNIRPLMAPSFLLLVWLTAAADRLSVAAFAADAPPEVSCPAWAIADGKTGRVLWSHDETTPRPMASTTKIMTAWIVLSLAATQPQVLDEIVTISEKADKTGGSTADVRAGEKIAAGNLLYGLMLPSGNDAAVALGEHFGSRFPATKNEGNGAATAGDSLALFVAEMNRRAAELQMGETKYLDPHGNSLNRSSPRDLVKLAYAAMQNPLFRKYVSTRTHEAVLTDSEGKERKAEWANTNKLLESEGFDGIKTGTTSAAGACLVSRGQRGDDQLLVVVLGSTTKDGRYTDSRKLYDWAWQMRGAAADQE